MLRLIAFFAQIFLPMAAAAAQAPSETAQRERKIQATAQHIFERESFSRAGFSSIAELSIEGREVRRMLLRDPYGTLPVPGVELERLDDRQVTLRLQYFDRSSDPVAIHSAAWDRLVDQESAIFAVSEYRPSLTPNKTPEPRAMCHGWIARFQADYHLTASWAACDPKTSGAGFDYAVAIIKLAIATKPTCVFDRADPFWSFSKCFASQSLDDPKLERTFSVLRKNYDLAPGVERLAEARRAINARLTIGSQSWLNARAAVARYKEVQDLRSEQLLRLRQLASTAGDGSAADKAKMQQTIETWTYFLKSQQTNYIELLQRLVWTEAGVD